MNTPEMDRVSELLDRGNYSEAIALLDRDLEIDPTVTSNYLYLGLAWLLQGDESEAQAIWLAAAIEESPESMERYTAELAEFLSAAASKYLQAHKFYLAEPIYQQILELDANRVEDRYNLGNALAQQGKFDEAIACWQDVISYQPDWGAAYRQLGTLFQKLADISAAIASYSQALTIQPDFSTAYNLGLCLIQQQQWAESIACFQQAIQLRSDYSLAYGDLGYALLQQGNLEQAIGYFQQAILLYPSFSTSYCNWVDNLVKTGRSHPSLNANSFWLKSLQSQISVAEAVSNFREFVTQKQDAEREQSLDISEVLTVLAPDEFDEFTADWVTATNLQPSNYINIYPAHSITLNPPKTLEADIDFAFRFGNQIDLPTSFVAILPEGRYWLNREQTSSAVITADDRLLGDLSPEFPIFSPGHPDNHPSKHSLLQAGKLLPPVKKIEGTVAVLAGLFNDVYFHWMFDILPRWELLHLGGIELDNIDWFFISDRLPFQQETIALLGIPVDKIITPEAHPHIQATKLVVPSFPGTVAWMPKWSCDFLRNQFLLPAIDSRSTTIERLYISRQDSHSRRIINEDELLDLLNKFGFQSVTLEAMTVAEQARLLANAGIVISAHGSGLTNLVFCRPGTKVIEILAPNYVYHCYWLVSNLADLDYYYLLGETPAGYYLHQMLYPTPRLEDIFVNLDTLQKMLEFAEVI
jgi:tetratricopeptide (TPR) repeat protein